MQEKSARSADDSFWAELSATIRCCQEPSGRRREDGWSVLRIKLRNWIRAFAHRKGHESDDEKNEFSDFMLSWLAGRGRLSSFDAQRGNFFTWFSRALGMGYADYVREELSRISPSGEEDVYSVELEAQDEVDALKGEARDELSQLPLSLRTAFKALHHSLLGPLDEYEKTAFASLFGIAYDGVRNQLDSLDAVAAARLLGKSSAWAYQVRSRGLKRLRETRNAI